MTEELPDSHRLLSLASAGDQAAWGRLLAVHQAALLRIVAFRMDPRLRARMDPADVVQDAFAEASAHRSDYFHGPAIPLLLWLRGVARNKLFEAHRSFLGTSKRDVRREQPLDARNSFDDTSAALCVHLTAGLTRPSVAVARDEAKSRLATAMSNMDPTDREVLALRHFEQLSNAEAGQILGIQERAAAKRYLRALQRLKELLADMPGGLTGIR